MLWRALNPAGQDLGLRSTWLTFIGRLENQFPEAAENRAAEEEDGEVTIHVAEAEGSERSISP